MKGRPITKKDLSEITNSDINSINDAINDLKNKYSNPNSAIEINEVTEWNKFIKILGYKYWDETRNDTYKLFLGASD